ncbi:MAG: DnaJ domain-containing protein [Caldilineaceae bacterium]
MDRYYQILELPPTATQEEIKSQYKQLVRLNHPDRFVALQDKVSAEEKLKAINEAYTCLTAPVATFLPIKYPLTPLDLTVTPTMLDFGSLSPNVRATRRFQVRFDEGIAENADFTCSEENSWFRMARVTHIYGADHSILEFDVAVDTRDLLPQTYQGWIDVYLDGTPITIPLSLQVTPGHRWYRYALLVAISLLALIVLPIGLLAFTRNNAATPSTIVAPAVLTEPVQLSPQQLSFALAEQQELSIYILNLDEAGSEPQGLGISGRAAVGSVAGQRVAYLGSDGEVHLLDLPSGESRELTSDGRPKQALAWAPDGMRLAYLVGSGEQSYIEVYHVATGAQAVLPGAGLTGVSHFAWSPDGEALLFDRWQGGARRVYRISLDGTDLQPLTTFDSWGGAWSPDGQQVVVSSPQGLYQLDRQGEHPVQVSAVVGEQPRWSADGRWLAYFTGTGEGQTLWLLELASGETTVVSRESVSSAWGPAGAQLAYVTGRATPGAGGEAPLLYLWTLTPGQAPQLLAEVNDPLFHWNE